MGVKGRKIRRVQHLLAGRRSQTFFPVVLSPTPTKADIQLGMTQAGNLAIAAVNSCSLEAPSAVRVQGLLYDAEVRNRNVRNGVGRTGFSGRKPRFQTGIIKAMLRAALIF